MWSNIATMGRLRVFSCLSPTASPAVFPPFFAPFVVRHAVERPVMDACVLLCVLVHVCAALCPPYAQFCRALSCGAVVRLYCGATCIQAMGCRVGRRSGWMILTRIPSMRS